jgi:hypothetical protein
MSFEGSYVDQAASILVVHQIVIQDRKILDVQGQQQQLNQQLPDLFADLVV